MDLVIRTPHFPRPGETLIGSEFHTVPGGKGANQAVAAARLGARVSMVGLVGDDAFGDALLSNLAAAGVDHASVTRHPQAPTGVAFIMVDDSGQNSIVVASGANLQLRPAGVDAAEALIAAADILLLQLESPLDAVTRAAEIARAHGVPVVLNPAPPRALPGSLLSLIDVLIPNEREATFLSGSPTGDQAGAKAAAAKLRTLGIETVIVTLRGRGALLARAEGTDHYPAFRVTAVDTTAAGDAFVGGFAVALAEGRSWAEAVRWGNGAGALAATALGAQPSLPTRQALAELIQARAG